MTTTELLPLILLGGGAFLLIGAAVHFTGVGSLNNIKSKTVGDGQHGTARWATKQEIQKTYRHIPFRPICAQGRGSAYCPGTGSGLRGRPRSEKAWKTGGKGSLSLERERSSEKEASKAETDSKTALGYRGCR